MYFAVAGICRGTDSGNIPAGNVIAVLNVGRCEDFNNTYDVHTGLNSQSTATLEEMPARKYAFCS